MRKEYELKQLRVKRRGPLPGLESSAERPAKIRITTALDQDVVEHFKAESAKPGGLPYQTQINQALRKALELDDAAGPGPSALKEALLHDEEFLEAVGAKVRSKPAA